VTRFIDLSIPISNDVVSDREVMRPKITYMTNEITWEQIAMFFPGLQRKDLPDGEGWAVEFIELSTHHGTHMDVPWHFHSTTDSGARPAPSIDEAPLDRFLRPPITRLKSLPISPAYRPTASRSAAFRSRSSGPARAGSGRWRWLRTAPQTIKLIGRNSAFYFEITVLGESAAGRHCRAPR
jgi:hypothetical protein